VVQKAFPGAIVLLHDGGGFRRQTVEALEQMIDQLNAQGYRFVTLSELQTFKDGMSF
jgi:peptidoglycan/xylan/chitin deacetylase (PgdA/CDA1 family)